MPSSFAHYAFAAIVLTGLGFRGRDRALLSFLAVAPDLDILTAAGWFMAAPHLPLGADTLITGAWLFGHRGLSHTLLAAALVGALVGWRRGRRWGWAAGCVWASHWIIDMWTPWAVTPWWPLSDATVGRAVVTSLDPLVTLTAVAAMLAIVAEGALPMLSRLDAATRERWSRIGARQAPSALTAFAVAFALSLAGLAATAALADRPFDSVQPAGFPATLTALERESGWVLEERWAPWSVPETTFVDEVRMANGTLEPAQAARLVDAAECALAGLGPWAPVRSPAWIVQPREGGVEVRGYDVVLNATREGQPFLVFAFEGERLARVHIEARPGDRVQLRIVVPEPVVEAARCPR